MSITLPVCFLRSTVTMTVSAFWHGIHPGYYLSFLTCVPILIAEDIWIDLCYKNATPGQQKLFNWVCWFFKMRFFDYMCMGFILLSWKATIHYWSSVYFIIHIIIAAFLITGLILKSSRHKKTAWFTWSYLWILFVANMEPFFIVLLPCDKLSMWPFCCMWHLHTYNAVICVRSFISLVHSDVTSVLMHLNIIWIFNSAFYTVVNLLHFKDVREQLW